MLNQAPLNSGPLNSASGAAPVVFSAAVSAVASAVVIAYRRRRYAAVATAVAAQVSFVTRRRLPAVAAATAAATIGANVFVARRGYSGGEAQARATAVVGWSQPRVYQGTGAVTVTASALINGALFVDLAAAATATAPAVLLTKRRRFDSVAPLNAVLAPVGFVRGRGYRASVSATAVGPLLSPDVTRGGVKFRYLGGVVGAAVTTNRADGMFIADRLPVAPAAAVATSAPAHPYHRRVRFPAQMALVDVFASVTSRINTGIPAQVGAVSAVATADALRVVLPVATGTARAVGFGRQTANPARFRPPGALSRATAVATVDRVRGFRGADALAEGAATADEPTIAPKLYGTAAFAIVSAIAEFWVRKLPRLFGAPASAVATAAPVVPLALRAFDATGVVAVAAGQAEFFTNIYDDEPDYRTYYVARQDFSYTVPVQSFVWLITSDATAMMTFTKQPGDRLAYDVDFSEWFEGLEGDDIEAAAIEVVSASAGGINDIIVEQPIRIGTPSTRVKFWTEGGTHGVRYKVTLTINTEGGRRKTVDGFIRVKEI